MTSAPSRHRRLPLRLVLAATASLPLAIAPTAPATATPRAFAEVPVTTTTTGEQSQPDIAMDADGDYVITWASFGQDGSGYGVYAQRYDAAGNPQGTETAVNTTTANYQNEPSVAMDADGDYVIAWASFGQDGSDYGVYAQRYDAAGNPQGTETAVNTTTNDSQHQPSVAMDADGDYVIAWASLGQDGDDYGVYAQRYNAAGNPQGTETAINTTTTYQQSQPSVAMDADGDYVITWASVAQDGGGYGVYARRFSAAGAASTAEILVNTTTPGHQSEPSVAMDADGDHVIAWTSSGQDGSGYGVYARRFSAASNPQGGETRANTTTLFDQFEPSVAMDADGDHVITWTSSGQDGSSYGVYVQGYDAAGSPQGAERRANITTPHPQAEQRVAMDADGDHVITWTSFGQDGSGYGVYARRFRGPEGIDLRLSHADNADPIAAGGRLAYRIRVFNRNESSEETGFAAVDAALGAASAVRVVTTPPEGATFTAASGSGWACGSSGSTLTCRFADTLAAGEVTPTLQLTYAAPDEAGPALHWARVSANQLDPAPADNGETERTSVLCSLEFGSSSFPTAEAGSLTATVTRHGTGCGATSVHFETASGSAISGSDFTDVAGTLVWSDADVDRTFAVPILADAIDETSEQLRLRLSNPVGVLLGNRSLVPGVIADNDAPPRINLTTTSSAAPESGALVEVTARLSAISGRPVTVSLTKAGTATGGSDYYAESMLTIPAGQRTGTFTIEVIDDTHDEPTETAAIALTRPIAAKVGTQRTFRLTITDDD